MNRYWDLSEKQRAELTEDEVRMFLDVELMERGVAKVKAPALHRITEPVLSRKTVARIKFAGQHTDEVLDVAFPTPEAALAFLALMPMVVTRSWETDVTTARPVTSGAVFTEELVPHDDALAAAVHLKGNRAKREENARFEREYQEAQRKVDDATKHVWEDWHDCRAKAARAKRVGETRDEYRRLAGSDELAETFLAKALGAPEVAFEREWASAT